MNIEKNGGWALWFPPFGLWLAADSFCLVPMAHMMQALVVIGNSVGTAASNGHILPARVIPSEKSSAWPCEID
ncbi:unnamed protein product [Clonostachys rosea f. rosea IK726]|uniref:Uncharacterized protein n=1 Tax=Clonostachys rosea f. rosea IK726 TaxID=1349383 RepID=A0ACA9ULC7_BIOOC|nr:unnamed protein product [Clonostachys rosea f. rosea IK726]